MAKRYAPPEFGRGGSPSRGALLAQLRASGAPGPHEGSSNDRRVRARPALRAREIARSARGE